MQTLSVDRPRTGTADAVKGVGVPGAEGPQPDEPTFRAGEAAELIGFGMTAKKVGSWVTLGKITAFRLDKGCWAQIPLSEIERIRRHLSERHRPTGEPAECDGE